MNTSSHISRRTFLAGTAKLGVAGLAAASVESLLGAQPQTAWQIGCYTRAFDQFEYPVALDAIAEAGFKHVGLMTTKIKQWVMIKTTTPAEEVQAMHQAARKRGLNVLSVYGEAPATDSLDAGIRGLKKLIDHAAFCECPHLMLAGTSDVKLYQIYYQTIAECCDYAAAKGVGLSIKPHGGQNATGPQCRKAIELVARKNFRLWYDPGNIFYYSDGKLDPVEDAATVDGLVVGMSVKDFLPPKEVLVNIGQGKVNFPKVFERLKRGGFTHGPLIVECLARGTLESVIAEARKARLFLEKLTGQQA
ncbi:MAG TPA: sugar phosphate isomerase/epimerase family protein [Candidatus Paceibacterota bacterium]|nr:sugar phosphate isomerase/epimerase family protein [Verrucomicrobiota bacterium]HSA09754.1 sugar phosphate isomerase/epimerase family protein [Candidatus Paceibacterota bacterium]